VENAFGAELKRRRLAAGWSQAELARRTNYTKPHISKVETGARTPTMEFARACDTALGAGGALIALALQFAQGQCPYPGLAAFDEGDARWFHGRRAAVATLLELLARRAADRGGPLLVVGPSGAGKSSLLRAGLLPALARGDLAGGPPTRAVVFTPTGEPMRRLAEVRAEQEADSSGEPALWVVDQVEEVFTACSDEDQQREFLDALCSEAGAAGAGGAAGARLVVLGVRADFYGRCLEHDGLLVAAGNGHLPLGPMTREELLAAVREPAGTAGIEFEPGPLDLLLHDAGLSPLRTGGAIGHDPGVLPLLAHTLRALWQQRSGRELTRAGYRAVGGLRGSVGATAERAWGDLDESAHDLARQLLLHLVHIADGTEPTRRRMPRSDLLATVPDPAAAVVVLNAFSDARLVTLDDDTVCLTHEAIVRAWPRLAAWIAQDRSGLLVKQRLEQDARAWAEHDRDAAQLYRGTRLALAAEWADRDSGRLGLSRLGAEFLAESQRLRHAEQLAAHRAARRMRRLVAGQAVLLALLLIAAGSSVAVWLGSEAANRRVTASSMMVGADTAASIGDPGLELQLAASAYRLDHGNKQAAWTLRGASGRPFAGMVPTGQPNQTELAMDPQSGIAFTSGMNGRITALDPATHRRLATFGPGTYGAPAFVLDPAFAHEPFRAPHVNPPGPIALSPHGHLLAASTGTHIDEWDLSRPTAPRWIRAFPAQDAFVNALTFSRDGATIAAAGGHDGNGPGDGSGLVTQWNATTGAVLAPGPLPLPAVAMGVAYSDDGTRLAVVGRDRFVRVWRRDGSALPLLTQLSPQTRSLIDVTFSPDSKTLVTTSDDDTAVLWDAATLHPRSTLHSLDAIFAATFNSNGSLLATASYDHSVQVWDPGTGSQIERLTGHTDRVLGVGFSPDGSALTSLDFDGHVAFWDLATSQRVPSPWSQVHGMALSPDGTLLATGDQSGLLRLWQRQPDSRDARDLHLLWQQHLPLPAGRGLFSMRFAPDGRTLGLSDDSSQVYLLDVATKRLTPLGALVDDSKTWGRSIAFAGSATMLSTTDHGETRSWDTHTARLIYNLGDLQPRALAADPHGRYVARPDGDKIALYDPTATTEPVTALVTAPLPPSSHLGMAMATNAAGTLLAAAIADSAAEKSVALWRVESSADHHLRLTPLPSLPASGKEINALVFSADGNTLAASGDDPVIHVWDTRTWQRATLLNASSAAVRDLVFSPDGSTLISSGDDGVIHFWDLDAPSAFRRAGRAVSSVGQGA
jgi:WD40 repeat protein/transcriptional regulator with XRE-family HTH domain